MEKTLKIERINMGRQLEFDIAKGISIFFMIAIHIIENITIDVDSPLCTFIYEYANKFLAATCFMFLMGVGIAYSKNNTPKKLLERGIILLTLGWLLNLCRYAIPYLIGWLVAGNSMYLGQICLTFSSDIMQFAGLAFLLMALFKKLKLSPFIILIIAMMLSVAGTLLEFKGVGLYCVDQFLGLLWGTKTESYFILFNWFIFVAVGYLYGDLYTRVEDKKKWHTRILCIGIPLSAIFFYMCHQSGQSIFRILNPEYELGFVWMRLPDAIGNSVMIITIMSLYWLISHLYHFPVLSHMSKNINKYYSISWVWVLSLCLANDIWEIWETDSQNALLFLFAMITAITAIIILFYKKYLEEKLIKFLSKNKIIWIGCVWIVTLIVCIFAFSYCEEYPNMFNGYLFGTLM